MATADALRYILPVFVAARGLVGAALLGVAAVGLTACSGSDEPRTLPSLSTTPAATSSPAANKQDELNAATAVVRRYFQVVNALRIDMNATYLAQLMTRDCECQEQVRAIRAAAAKGERYLDVARLVSVTPSLDAPGVVSVLVQYNAGRGGLVDASGRQVTSAPPRRGVRRLFRVRREGARWLIYAIQAA